MKLALLAAALAAATLTSTMALAAEVNVYNGRHYTTDRAFFDEFTRRTGIKVNTIEGDSDQLLQRIRSEGANTPADVLITVDAGRLAAAAEAGLFQPVQSAALNQAVPAEFRDPQGQWFGLAARARVLIYAKDRVKPSQLSTYEDLADPKWKGKLLVRSGTNIYNLSLVGSMLAAYGPEKAEAWARGVQANLARPSKGGDTDQIRAVAAGEGDVAISNTYYLGRLIASNRPEDKAVAEKVAVFYPNQNDRGTHVNVSGAGVLKTSKNKEAAVKLLEFLASPEGQRYFADTNFEFPVNGSVKAHPILSDFGDFKRDRLNAAIYGANNRQAMMIMDRVGWR